MNDLPPGVAAFQIVATLHQAQDLLEAAVAPLGLSLAKLGVLSRLADAGEPLPLRTLAERCACVRSNITQLVDRLEADKLVVRADDPHDRRSIRAELTARGRARHAEGVKAIQEAERELLARLPAGKRQALLELLGCLREG
jgi:DNA-binding MarR family transcriptional regulator